MQEERANGLDALRLQSLSEQREYLDYARWEKGLEKVAHGVQVEQIAHLTQQVEVRDLKGWDHLTLQILQEPHWWVWKAATRKQTQDRSKTGS